MSATLSTPGQRWLAKDPEFPDVVSLFEGHLSDLRSCRQLIARHLKNHRDDLGPLASRRIERALELIEQAELGLECVR
jgi:hypothetical protein